MVGNPPVPTNTKCEHGLFKNGSSLYTFACILEEEGGNNETKAFDRDKLKSVSIKMLLIPLIAKTNRRFSSLCRP